MMEKPKNQGRWIGKKTPAYLFYATVVLVILTLTGMFGSFSTRTVVEGRLSLSLVALAVVMAVAAYFVVRSMDDAPAALLALNGAITGAVLALVLCVLIYLETTLNIEDIVFVFQNYKLLGQGLLTFGAAGDNLVFPGMVLLVLFSVGVGILVALYVQMPERVQQAVGFSLALTVVFGLMTLQIRSVMSLPEAVTLFIAFVGGYGMARRFAPEHIFLRPACGLAAGAIVGIVVTLLVLAGAASAGGILSAESAVTRLMTLPDIARIVVFALVGAAGGLSTAAPVFIHNGAWYLFGSLIVFGLLNAAGKMTDLVALAALVVFGLTAGVPPVLAENTQTTYDALPEVQKKISNRLSAMLALVVMLVAPVFLGQYITNVLDLVMLYIIMGIGLNIMVGYAGLLDLGYVASFAIGAYTAALLTTPSVITTGCVNTEAIQGYRYYEMCTGMISNWSGTGVLTFWQALPVAVLASATAGLLLGIPVLRLRGDYFAIVTLGFGEITRVITRASITEPLLGSAQGIGPIPFPVIDLSSQGGPVINLDSAQTVYYIYIVGVLIAIFVLTRLADSRVGRAWRAMRADEDVAAAMGVSLVRARLLAFAISAAFAGMSGAFFGAQLRGIFPDSFTILVSINVLCLIIIGGLRSIPGVIVGALMLVGLPEALRELQDYRLLAFGVLLVVAMLLRPQGLLPPKPRPLSLVAEQMRRAK